MAKVVSMEPVSARLPSDLYMWLAGLELDGAITNSDKIRVLLSQLKRQHEGAMDYASAHAWVRDLTAHQREGVVRSEDAAGGQSELMLTLLEQCTALLAILISGSSNGAEATRQLEQVMVRRVFGMAEGLLRQAMSSKAAAFDETVVKRHCGGLLELANLLSSQTGSNNNG